MDIKEIINQAKKLTLDPDLNLPQYLRPTAFKEIFRVLLSFHHNVHEDGDSTNLKVNTTVILDANEFFTRLSNQTGVDDTEIHKIYEYYKGTIRLITPTLGKNIKGDQEKDAALLVLYAYKIGLNQETLPASILRQRLKDYGLGGSNFSTNVKSLKAEITSFSKSKSGESNYKLTFPGEQKTIEIIKGLINQNESHTR